MKCECGMDPAEHSKPLVLLHHDQEMRKATIERLRGNLAKHGVMPQLGWLWLDALLTDEEVGR
jgi:hypothetical protein